VAAANVAEPTAAVPISVGLMLIYAQRLRILTAERAKPESSDIKDLENKE
jgi:hypothetical protein